MGLFDYGPSSPYPFFPIPAPIPFSRLYPLSLPPTPHLFSPIPSPHPAMTKGKGARKHLQKKSREDNLTFPHPPQHHKTFFMGGRGCYKVSAGRMNNPIKKIFGGEEIKTLILEIIYQKLN